MDVMMYLSGMLGIIVAQIGILSTTFIALVIGFVLGISLKWLLHSIRNRDKTNPLSGDTTWDDAVIGSEYES